jgi:microcystin-dependent protein
MAQPYVGEIRMFGGNFAPAGWMFCEGQLLPISEFETLFNLIGTTYGGDGQSTFALPDLRGRLPVHQGTSNTGSAYVISQTGGTETVTLTTTQLPAHSHGLVASTAPGSAAGPGGNVLGASGTVAMYSAHPPSQSLNSGSLSAVGGSQPHDNFQPYLCVSFIISLFGIFPSQT